mmetsp:Transcript_8387/g.15711  ORF Transcript_8387/g.15711 Transcript_8387/m.15711 type:complete len:474 (-) Transcript_8387:163-1584(-)
MYCIPFLRCPIVAFPSSMWLPATFLILIVAYATSTLDSSNTRCHVGNDFCQDDVTSLLQVAPREQIPANMHVGPCIARVEDLPSSWKLSVGEQALAAMEARINRSDNAQQSFAGTAAARTAFAEVLDIALSPGMIREHGEEALDAVMSCASTWTDAPDQQERALGRARDVLVELGLQFSQLQKHGATCEELKHGGVPTLIRHGNYLRTRLPYNATLDGTLHLLVDFANEAVVDCEDLATLLGFEPSRRLAMFPKTAPAVAEDAGGSLYGALIAAGDIAGMLSDENIKLPAGALQFLGDFWNYLSKYPFPNATELVDQPSSLISIGHFVADAASYASGSGRYTLEMKYAPWMYRFVRENFYAILQTGQVDFIGKLLRTLQDYKCNSANDVQVHDGLNFLLKRFDVANHSWVKQADSTDASVDRQSGVENYKAFRQMHQAWAVCGAFGQREFEEPETYGSVVRQAMAFADFESQA